MRRFSRFIKGGDNISTTSNVTPQAEPSNRVKTPSSPQERKEGNLLETNFRTKKSNKSSTPQSPLPTVTSSSIPSPQQNDDYLYGVKKVVSNRKHLFLSHVKQKKIKLDKLEQSCLMNQHSTSTCGKVGRTTNNNRNSLENLELWTSFHSKQGLYSYFYMDEVVERYGQFEMKEPPKIIARRKTCA